jgi:aryl-alcohol dehydrogenase-like predicted oxidoreductase
MVSEISFGAWAIGGAWGQVSEKDALAALHQAVDSGVNFIDTADVYGDGRSERLIANLKKERKEEIVVATKAGRRLPRQTIEGYSRENLTAWIEGSLRNIATDTLDLLQLHCPPTELYSRPEVFAMMDDFVRAGKIRYYGVSVETVEEALPATACRSFLREGQAEAGWHSRACAAGQRLADRQTSAGLHFCF